MRKKTYFFQNCLGVFQGGGCRASAYVGAYKEAISWGVTFSELVGTSAGAIIAALIGAGATPEYLEEIIDELDFKSFLRNPQKNVSYKSPKGSGLLKYIPNINRYAPIITHLGCYDSSQIREWLDEKLSELLPDKSKPIKFHDLLIPTNIIVTDIEMKRVEIYNQERSGNFDVSKAVQCSCNIPIFFQPVDNRYVDGGVLSNLPSFIYENSEKKTYNKVLAFSLESKNPNQSLKINNLKDYGKALINTIIDGNLDLQLSLQDDVHIIKIDTGGIKATDFVSIKAKDITTLKKNGAEAVNSFFLNEVGNIKIKNKNPNVAKNQFETYNKIVQLLEYKYEEVIIFDSENEWAYNIFPTILKWSLDKTKIYFIYDSSKQNKKQNHTNYRNRLLKHMGVIIQDIDQIPFTGFIFNGNKRTSCKAIILNSNNDRFHSKYYFGEEDFPVISFIREQYIQSLPVEQNYLVKITPIDINIIKKELRKVLQYSNSNVKITQQNISIDKITFLTKYVKGYKYRQVESLFNLYNNNSLSLFESAQLELKNGKYSIIVPPIIEKVGELYYLIEGNARLLYAYNNKISSLNCIIIENVNKALPSSGHYDIKRVLITDKDTKGGERYTDFDYNNFRHIEEAIRDPETTLI